MRIFQDLTETFLSAKMEKLSLEPCVTEANVGSVFYWNLHHCRKSKAKLQIMWNKRANNLREMCLLNFLFGLICFQILIGNYVVRPI